MVNRPASPVVYVAEDDKRDLIGIIMHEYTLYFEGDTMNGHTPCAAVLMM